MHRIEIHSTEGCPWCSPAKSLLRAKGHDFEETDVSSGRANATEMAERSGRRTVPQIFVDDEPVGRFDALSKMDLPDRQD